MTQLHECSSTETPVPARPRCEIVAMINKIQDAPDDVVIQICQHLSVRDILVFRQVSFRLNPSKPGENSTHTSQDVQTCVRGVVSKNAVVVSVYRPCHRSRDTIPRHGAHQSDVRTRAGGRYSRGPRSQPSLVLRTQVRTKGESGLAGKPKLSHL